MMKKELVLLRGLPGSGKSTVGLLITKNPLHVLSADDYFTDENGKYNFDINKIKLAHDDCKERCENLMKNDTETIVVANTFTQEWEMKNYQDLAEKYSYRIHFLIAENRHGSTNIHNVPTETLDKMRYRFEIKLL